MSETNVKEIIAIIERVETICQTASNKVHDFDLSKPLNNSFHDLHELRMKLLATTPSPAPEGLVSEIDDFLNQSYGGEQVLINGEFKVRLDMRERIKIRDKLLSLLSPSSGEMKLIKIKDPKYACCDETCPHLQAQLAADQKSIPAIEERARKEERRKYISEIKPNLHEVELAGSDALHSIRGWYLSMFIYPASNLGQALKESEE